jgi:glutathione S-transferase
MPTVYGVPASPFVRKVLVALTEKGIAYDREDVIPVNVSAEYKKISPLGKIPAFRDGDVTLADSSVIIAYLEKTKAEPALYPSDPRDYARALWFEEYGDGGLAPIVGPKIFFEKVVGPRLFKRPTDEAVVRQAINEDLPPMYDYLESQLGSGDWLVGGRFSIADIGITTQLVQPRLSGFPLDASRWPKLSAYLERALQRPSFKDAVAKATAMLGLT